MTTQVEEYKQIKEYVEEAVELIVHRDALR